MQQLGEVATARIEFERWLEHQPLAARTKSEYRRNHRVFLESVAAGEARWPAIRSAIAWRAITLHATFGAG